MGLHHEGVAMVSNKTERAARMCADIEKILRAGRTTPSEIAALRGALNFAKAQCFGRCGAASLCYLSEAVRSGPKILDATAKEHLKFWPRYFELAKPRTVRYVDGRPPAVIFTDGAEERYVSVGGLLVDPVTGSEHFGGTKGSSRAGSRRAAGKEPHTRPRCIRR